MKWIMTLSILVLLLSGTLVADLAHAKPAHTPHQEAQACAMFGSHFSAVGTFREAGWSLNALALFISDTAPAHTPPTMSVNDVIRIDLVILLHIYHHPRYAQMGPAANQKYAERRCQQRGVNAFWDELDTFAQSQAWRFLQGTSPSVSRR